jgi:hypothetical protein
VRTELDINRSLRGSCGASNDANFGGLAYIGSFDDLGDLRLSDVTSGACS